MSREIDNKLINDNWPYKSENSLKMVSKYLYFLLADFFE